VRVRTAEWLECREPPLRARAAPGAPPGPAHSV